MQQGTPPRISDSTHDDKSVSRKTTILSGLIFFFLLYGYFLLRPLREAMGVQRSMSDLRSLFLATCIISLVVSLLFGSLVSRANPKRFMTIGYRVVIACLLVFALTLKALPDDYKLYSGYVFYIWLSVINLFMVSVFWGFMADTWTLADAKRLYPIIGVGGTLGATLGSLTVWQFGALIDKAVNSTVATLFFFSDGAEWTNRITQAYTSIRTSISAGGYSTIIQMLGACLCFELAVRCVHRISGSHHTQRTHHHQPIGGSWYQGASTLLSSIYLLGIGTYISYIAISSTLIYFTQAKIVTEGADQLAERIALFAQLDLWAQLATLLVQLFVTAKIIKHLGIAFSLCILPVITLLGFAAVAQAAENPNIEPWQLFAVLAIFSAIHRAARYAIIRPARETLFSVVSRQEKYKSKPIIDVFLYRGGDVAGTGIESMLAGAAIGLWGMVMVAAPLAALWSGLAIALAVLQSRMQHNNTQPVSTDTQKPQETPS